ncbi:MAG: hypothetical protein AB8B65_08595 [Kordia sp.]|uniref:hypothetical protein n=1 Tax=Kordia sp. TaxID=1965332 RepID=UPI00385CAE0C
MYFTWQLINILAIVALVIYAIKFIYNFKKHKVKSISYFAVTLGLLIISNFIGERKSTKDFVLHTVSETVSNETPKFTKNIIFIDALAFDIYAQMLYTVNDTEIIPRTVTPVFDGFLVGFDWELQNFITEKNQNGKIEYKAVGELDWKILGIPFYTQTKEFKGTFTIQE